MNSTTAGCPRHAWLLALSLAVVGCHSPPRVDTTWSKAIESLGLTPIFPPSSAVRERDIYVANSLDALEEQDRSAALANLPRWDTATASHVTSGVAVLPEIWMTSSDQGRLEVLVPLKKITASLHLDASTFEQVHVSFKDVQTVSVNAREALQYAIHEGRVRDSLRGKLAGFASAKSRHLLLRILTEVYTSSEMEVMIKLQSSAAAEVHARMSGQPVELAISKQEGPAQGTAVLELDSEGSSESHLQLKVSYKCSTPVTFAAKCYNILVDPATWEARISFGRTLRSLLEETSDSPDVETRPTVQSDLLLLAGRSSYRIDRDSYCEPFFRLKHAHGEQELRRMRQGGQELSIPVRVEGDAVEGVDYLSFSRLLRIPGSFTSGTVRVEPTSTLSEVGASAVPGTSIEGQLAGVRSLKITPIATPALSVDPDSGTVEVTIEPPAGEVTLDFEIKEVQLVNPPAPKPRWGLRIDVMKDVKEGELLVASSLAEASELPTCFVRTSIDQATPFRYRILAVCLDDEDRAVGEHMRFTHRGVTVRYHRPRR